jgi:uncharacterized protein YbjT (DUF2867 family)
MILITGGTGYVGTHTVHELHERGGRVRCVVRRGASGEKTAYLRKLGLEIVEADLTDARQLESALDGVDTIAHLAGSIRPARGETPRMIHVDTTKSLLRAAQQRGIRRFVLLSSLGARQNGNTEYHRTKWVAEEAVRDSGIPFVIVRPTLIFGLLVGTRESKLMSRMTQAILRGSTIRLVAGGQNIIRPIFVGDVAHCLVEAILGNTATGIGVDLGGPEQMTFEQLIERLARHHGCAAKTRRVPFGPAFVLAKLLERFVESPPFTSTEVRALREDNTCEIDKMKRTFHIEPVSLECGLSLAAEREPLVAVGRIA